MSYKMYMSPQREWFLRLKTAIDFDHFRLKMGMNFGVRSENGYKELRSLV